MVIDKLRALYATPKPNALNKQLDSLDEHSAAASSRCR